MNAGIFQGKRILILGGTGSLGSALLNRIIAGDDGLPSRIVVFSRDEGKQHDVRTLHAAARRRPEHTGAQDAARSLEFRIGDIRDYSSVLAALRDIDIVFNVAAMKQVPTCEYFPFEAVATNVIGAENIVRAIRDHQLPVRTVVGISTDKAVSPVNVLGMTKAIQERIFARASLDVPATRFIMIRYGNVLASRGSVIPTFEEQIKNGGPVTITHQDMTRFMLTIDDAIATVIDALAEARTSEIYVPRLRGVRINDVATALIDGRRIETAVSGLRPGEKLHEVLISSDELHRTFQRGAYHVIAPILPELGRHAQAGPCLDRPITSDSDIMSLDEVCALMRRAGLLARLRPVLRVGR
jgi:UDP-glucose 4-epimerase